MSNTNRFLKYLAGGSVYFWVGYAVFAICYSIFKWDWLPAKILADVIGWSLNYIVQRFWAFGDRIHLSEMQHAGRYLLIESVGFILDYRLAFSLSGAGSGINTGYSPKKNEFLNFSTLSFALSFATI
jgi:putative flippase GtrA